MHRGTTGHGDRPTRRRPLGVEAAGQQQPHARFPGAHRLAGRRRRRAELLRWLRVPDHLARRAHHHDRPLAQPALGQLGLVPPRVPAGAGRHRHLHPRPFRPRRAARAQCERAARPAGRHLRLCRRAHHRDRRQARVRQQPQPAGLGGADPAADRGADHPARQLALVRQQPDPGRDGGLAHPALGRQPPGPARARVGAAGPGGRRPAADRRLATRAEQRPGRCGRGPARRTHHRAAPLLRVGHPDPRLEPAAARRLGQRPAEPPLGERRQRAPGPGVAPGRTGPGAVLRRRRRLHQARTKGGGKGA